MSRVSLAFMREKVELQVRRVFFVCTRPWQYLLQPHFISTTTRNPMKHLLLSTSMIFTAMIADAATAELPAKPSLVAYWNFDDDSARDFSGNGHDGSTGAGFVDAPEGFGRAVDLEESFLNIDGDKRAFSLGTGTITFRVRLSDSKDRQTILSIYDDISNRFHVARRNGKLRIAYAGQVSTSVETDCQILSDTWYTVVATEDGAIGWSIWIAADGGAQVNPELPGNKLGFTSFLKPRRIELGGLYVGGLSMDGQLDNVAVWNEVLSQERIDKIFSGGLYDDADGVINLEVLAQVAEYRKQAEILAAAAPRGPTLVDVTSPMGITGTGSTAAWGDYDNDGWVDLYDGRLWHNTLGSNGEGFEQVEMPATGAGIWADYDNDGFLDLYVIQQHKLVRFDGEKFVDVSSLLPPKQIMRSYAATWGDFDGDGFVDLYVTGFETVSHAAPIYDIILKNEAGKGFKHVWNARWKYAGRGVTIADYDEDGDTDIYVSNYRLLPNYMWRNNGSGGFQDIGGHNGTSGDGAGKAWGHTIGSCWGDFDNDGHIDLFVGNFSHAPAYQDRCKFYRNLGPEGDYGFVDLSGEVDFRWQESYASPALGDVDGDGFLDVVITTYYSGDKAMMVANRSADLATARPTNLSHDQSPIGKWTFAEVTEDVGIVASRTSQAAWADFDNDGDLDLMLGGKLLRNEMTARRWLKVKLDAPSTAEGKLVNRAAIGATVRVHVNGWVLTRTVEGGTGQANQNDLTLHFGLGDYSGTVGVEVSWPDGSKQKTTAAIDRVVRITKGEMRRL